MMRTTPLERRLLAMVLAIAFAVFPPAALGGYRDDMHVTSIEVALLPQFCWLQFEVPNTQGEEFRIRDCGVAANHYCPGLIYLIRGKRQTKKNNALSLLQHADIDVRYTESAIAGSPNCSIREHVDKTRAEINHLLRMYGGKPVGAK
jgi:hypothetical protein